MVEEAFADLADLPEDERIEMIGLVAEQGVRVRFIVEDDAKADRYIAKLCERFKVRVVERGEFVKGLVCVMMGPLTH